jgi:hypothetical protein
LAEEKREGRSFFFLPELIGPILEEAFPYLFGSKAAVWLRVQAAKDTVGVKGMPGRYLHGLRLLFE